MATPLHFAAHVADLVAATALLAAGANADARSVKDVTPLHVAARRNACGVAVVLLASGASVDPRNVDGDTPLHRAASGDALKAAAVLLACGADVDVRARDGAAPLHVAALKDAHATAALLLERGAFEFLVLTVARSAEVRLATWGEVDRDAAVWAIPGTRMKTRREHRVPLCGRAVEILDEAGRLRGNGSAPAPADLVFPSPRAKALSDMTLSMLVKEQGIAAVPHGFRSSFRDWASERTNHPREVVEAALAHVVGNQTEAAYARSDLFERRRRLMDDWAAYLDRPRGKVVVFEGRSRADRARSPTRPSGWRTPG